MANTFKFGAGKWAIGDGTALAYNDENDNFKPLPFDFTRASNATVVNKQGLIETVPSGKPRIDFLNNTKGHLLLEPSRTNVITDSEISTTTPTTTGDGYSENITLTNGLSGKKLGTTSSGRSFVSFTSSVSSGTQYTLSLFVENYIGSSISNFVDILSGGNNEDFSSDLISDGKLVANFTTTSTSVTIRIGIGTTSTQSGVRSCEVSGVQLEAGSYATSYIPTEGSSVTRVADVNSKTSDEGSIIDSAKTIYVEFDELGISRAQRRHMFQLSGSSGSTVYGRTESGGTLTIQVLNSSVNQALFQSVSYNTTGNNKLALTISENDVVLYVNGTQAGSDTNASIPTLYKMYVGISDAGTIPFAGGIKDCKLYNTRLTDTELQNLTS